jgi:Holliday junction resolvase
MAKKPETAFKEVVLKDLKALPDCWVEKIQQVGKRGTPDILGVLNGYMLAIELKKDAKEKPDKLQQHKLELIRKAGGLTYVACPENWNEIYDNLLLISIKGKRYVRDHRDIIERELFSSEESL